MDNINWLDLVMYAMCVSLTLCVIVFTVFCMVITGKLIQNIWINYKYTNHKRLKDSVLESNTTDKKKPTPD